MFIAHSYVARGLSRETQSTEPAPRLITRCGATPILFQFEIIEQLTWLTTTFSELRLKERYHNLWEEIMCRAWNWQALNKAIGPLISRVDVKNLFLTVFFHYFVFKQLDGEFWGRHNSCMEHLRAHGKKDLVTKTYL